MEFSVSEDKPKYDINMALESAKATALAKNPTVVNRDDAIIKEQEHIANTMQLRFDDEGKSFFISFNSKDALLNIQTIPGRGKITDATMEVNIADSVGKIHVAHVEMLVECLAAIMVRSSKVGGVYGVDNTGEQVTERSLIEWLKAKIDIEYNFQLFESKGVKVR
jgi:hypothetical protein